MISLSINKFISSIAERGLAITGLLSLNKSKFRSPQSSLGIMVNYRYHLNGIERNHEQYEHSGLVISSQDVTQSANKFRNSIQHTGRE